MRFYAMRSGAGDRLHRRTSVLRGLAGALLLSLVTAARAAAQVPDTLPVTNRATVSYEAAGAIHTGTDTATSTVVMKLSAGVALTPPRQASARPGERRVLPHLLQNTGTGPDAFALTTAGPAGWGISLYLDLDGDGVLGAGDTPVTGPLPLARGASAALLLVLDVPADAPDDPAVTVDVRAVSQMDAAVTATVRDEINVRRPLPSVTMGKSVDRPQATPGDTLTYTLLAINAGDAAAPAATLADPLPAGVRYVPGSLRLNGASLTDEADADAGRIARADDGRETVRVALGDLVPAATRTVTFRVVVGADASATLTNIASLRFPLGEGPGDTVTVASPAIGTVVTMPELTIGKELVGEASVPLGSEVSFRITWGNASASVPVRDGVLVDTLPAGLTFVSADRQPEVDGQVLRWLLGNIAPGQTGAVTLVTRATARPADGEPLVNHVTLRGANAAAVSALALGLDVQPFQGDELEVTKTAGVLEAGLGEAVPYAVTLRNAGLAPLAGIVLHDTLPTGVNYLPEHLSGADSARVQGRELTVWWNGPLQAGEEHVVRYAVTLVSPGNATVVENRVVATAEDGAVRSAAASAWLRVRRGFAMQQRVVIGKVWYDANDDGRQNEGEQGVPGVEVWSEDGEIVTTDAEGRYSFPNLRTGTHALRLDTLSVPAGMGLARRADIIQRIRLDGWTLPRADFRLVPRNGGPTLAPAPAADGGAPRNDAAPAPAAPPVSAPAVTPPAPALAPPAASLPAAPAPAAAPTVMHIDSATAVWTEEDAREGARRIAAAGGQPCPTPAGKAPRVVTAVAPVSTVIETAPVETAPASVPTDTVTTTVAVASAAQAAGTDTVPARVMTDSVPALRVAGLRTAEERAAEEAGSFATGPVVRVFSPADGAVVSSNRLYVGVAGEPGAQVKLFDGTRQVAEGMLRPDGKIDFIGLEIAPGPHRLRVAMTNSWGAERWDSVAIHRSGAPDRLELPAGAVQMRADDRGHTAVRVRVLDEWGVPLAGGATVTAEAGLAEMEGGDADLASVGVQSAVGKDGWAELRVRPGHEVGVGELTLTAGDARGRIPLHILPNTRPLIVTGAGEVGVGAAPEAFGSVTARGAIGDETTVAVTWDSRRTDADDEFFGGGYDPLDEGRYPTLGDGSQRRVLAGATQTLSARVEHGFDWLELGDVRTAEFGGERLGVYQRALTGVSGRVTTGALTWHGYGSVTDQVLSQQQRRGEGTSGPYRFGGGIRPGTERVAIEVRALDNAARVIARQELVRFNDYQIDYLSGDILLNHPVPAADAAGNPVYVVAMLERRSGGDRKVVGGLRMDLDALRLVQAPGWDSVRVSLMGVHDAGEGAGESAERNLVGGGLLLRRGGFSVSGELLRSMRPDTAALAGVASLAWTAPDERARLGAEWLRVGAGFAPGTDPRLAAGVEELRLSGDVRVARGSRLRLSHERQRFDGYDVERANTLLGVEQSIAGRALTAQGGVSDDRQGDSESTSAVGKVVMAVSSELDVWVDGTRNLSRDEDLPVSRPDQVGVGASYRLFEGLRLDGSHRWVKVRGDSAYTYGLSAMNLRYDRFFGGQVWGGLERAGSGLANHSAVLGWSHRMAISGGWSATGMYERRFGLARAPLLDPNRALPFAQAERNRWSTGAGVEWLPTDSMMRFSARAEVHGGDAGRGYRFDVAGDAPVGRDMAILTRHDWLRDERSDLTGGDMESRRDRSLLGLALRPAGWDQLNVLAKLEWRRTSGPLGGTTGLLSGVGEDRRLIGAMDAVWGVRPGTELAARWATRWSMRSDSSAGISDLGSLAHFVGGRADQSVTEMFRLRMDARLLLDAEGGSSAWNLAPALVAGVGGLELEAGYRFGDLVDADFAAQGGEGFYAILGIRFTEGLLTDVGSFWRERIVREP